MKQCSWIDVQERIQAAAGIETLRAVRDQTHEAFRNPLLFSDFNDFLVRLNWLHDALIYRAVELAVQSMADKGLNKPKLAFTFLLFGSGGRQEQTFWSDQDNGLVYEDPVDEAQAREAEWYFNELAVEIHVRLFALGYPPCSGEVLARNPMWRKSYSEYTAMVHAWMEEPSWENIRYLLIFFDIRGVFGKITIAERLKRECIDYAASHPAVLQAMVRNTLHHKVSVGIFGQLIPERYGQDAGSFDIKYGAYIPIVNGIRLLAVQARVGASSTINKIEQLKDRSSIPTEQYQEWRTAAEIALKLRAITPFQIVDGMYSTRGKLPLDTLPKELLRDLKQCLRIGHRLQKFVRDAVRGD